MRYYYYIAVNTYSTPLPEHPSPSFHDHKGNDTRKNKRGSETEKSEEREREKRMSGEK